MPWVHYILVTNGVSSGSSKIWEVLAYVGFTVWLELGRFFRDYLIILGIISRS